MPNRLRLGRLSLRFSLLVVSFVLAFVVIGGISLTTYVIVADGMRQAAEDSTVRIAETAAQLASESARVVDETTARPPVVPMADYVDRLARTLTIAGAEDVGYALYDESGMVLWSSEGDAVFADLGATRARTLADGTHRITRVDAGTPFDGLLTSANLGLDVTHVRVGLPAGALGVLDVSYEPAREEAVIDSVRLPMLVLSVSAMIVMVVLMQTSMVWVLRLVDNLRRAADSINAGRLGARLPRGGRNEIGELARSLNNLLERLDRRSEAQARFIADASHELATPVAGIRGYTSILKAWGADDPVVREEAISAIDRESRRMARLTGDLLNVMQSEQGIVFKTEPFDVNSLGREALAVAASTWLSKDIEFVGPDESPLTMVGDPDRLTDVMRILLDNAAKYTPSGGTVALTTRRRRDHVTIEVADTGQGIAADDVPHIFDRFYRTDASRASGESGFGLGLAIAKNIIDSAGGTITVSSTPNEGTVFKIDLPRGRA